MLSKEEALKKARLMKCGFIGNVKVVASKDVNKLIREIYSANQCKCTELKWIPVEERLPEESLNSVIGWDAYRECCVFVQYYMNDWILGNHESVKIVAWMPLPSPYKRKENEE